MAEKKPVDFAEKFWPPENPFKVSIAKVLPPRQSDGSGPTDAYLIKVKALVALTVEKPEDTAMFQKLMKTLETKKSFCGVWTPEFSEPYFDSSEMSVELTGYLKQGQEDKILHLDHVARASHQKEQPAETEDDVMVESFLTQLRKGTKLKDAVTTAERETRAIMSRGRKAELEIDSDGLDRPVRLDTPQPPKVHKPPPGPGLQKGAPPPGPPSVRPPEGQEPRNEVFDAVALTSKDRDSELDSSDTDTNFDVKKASHRDEKKPANQTAKVDSTLQSKNTSATIDRDDERSVEMDKKKQRRP